MTCHELDDELEAIEVNNIASMHHGASIIDGHNLEGIHFRKGGNLSKCIQPINWPEQSEEDQSKFVSFAQRPD